jgi:hypothetical protein
MARYFLDKNDTSDAEPVEFRALVKMVRDGAVDADRLVREEHSVWQYAGDVIGLFHLAGRTDVLELWEEERRQREVFQRNTAMASGSNGDMSLDDIESLLEHADGLAGEEEEPAWQKRLREVEAQRTAEGAALAAENADESETAQIQALKEKAIQDALAATEGRYVKSRVARALHDLTAMFSSHTLHLLFRFGAAILAGNLAAAGILSWSDKEAQRFPSKNAENAYEMIFPLWGSCSRVEYYFLLFDAAIFAAVIGYIGAIQLERMADD